MSTLNFLQAVTRIMQAEGIIRGDTDAPTTFSDLQHGATIGIAQIAVQDELNELTADLLLPYEKSTSGSISGVVGTRSYALASDFIRFYGVPMLYDSTNNRELYEWPGGEDNLKLQVFNYKTFQGDPFAWYFEGATTKQISLYPVPSVARTYSYDYEKDVSVSATTDSLPFHNNQEAHAFCRLAARRFKYLYQGTDIAKLYEDSEHLKAKAALMAVIAGRNPSNSYAPVYR